MREDFEALFFIQAKTRHIGPKRVVPQAEDEILPHRQAQDKRGLGGRSELDSEKRPQNSLQGRMQMAWLSKASINPRNNRGPSPRNHDLDSRVR